MNPFLPTLPWWTALLVVAAGCNNAEETVPPELAGTLELDGQQTATIEPGTVLERSSDQPTFWASAPAFDLRVSTSDDDPAPTTVQLENLAALSDMTPSIGAATRLTSEDHPGCPDRPGPDLDCTTDDHPACAPPRLETQGPTEGTLHVDLPDCVRVRYRFAPKQPDDRRFRVAVVGATASPTELSDILSALADDPPDVAVLTGDHARRSTVEALDNLARRLRVLNFPVVVLEGETERIGNVQGGFQNRFGPRQLHWTVHHTDLVTFGSGGRWLRDEDPDGLRERLRNTDADTPTVAFTHTPPHDPNGLRDQGFRSRLEGARVTSTLRDRGVDLLVTGHLPARARYEVDDLAVVTASAQSRLGYTVVELPADGAASTGLTVRRRDLR